ncbi:MAG TPA: cytochrome c-type biogenesis protein [Miltoncostaeaceae bacterium]|nr:cytochrome c-type biogenesis protein [Miltoncostaeaceae bacterium]
MRGAALILALLALVALPAAAGAVTVSEVAREVRCPTCNTPLDVSNSPAASDMKRYIAERIDRGWEKQRIIDGLVAEFGEGVLATPPKSGFDLIAWLVPGLAVLAGIVGIGLLAWTWSRRRPTAAGPDAPPPTAEEARRLEDELRRLR